MNAQGCFRAGGRKAHHRFDRLNPRDVQQPACAGTESWKTKLVEQSLDLCFERGHEWQQVATQNGKADVVRTSGLARRQMVDRLQGGNGLSSTAQRGRGGGQPVGTDLGWIQGQYLIDVAKFRDAGDRPKATDVAVFHKPRAGSPAVEQT